MSDGHNYSSLNSIDSYDNEILSQLYPRQAHSPGSNILQVFTAHKSGTTLTNLTVECEESLIDKVDEVGLLWQSSHKTHLQTTNQPPTHLSFTSLFMSFPTPSPLPPPLLPSPPSNYPSSPITNHSQLPQPPQQPNNPSPSNYLPTTTHPKLPFSPQLSLPPNYPSFPTILPPPQACHNCNFNWLCIRHLL